MTVPVLAVALGPGAEDAAAVENSADNTSTGSDWGPQARQAGRQAMRTQIGPGANEGAATNAGPTAVAAVAGADAAGNQSPLFGLIS